MAKQKDKKTDDLEVAKRIHEAMKLRGMGFNELDRALGKQSGWASRTIRLGRSPS